MHVFVTGISSGIGKAFLEYYLNEGVEVTGIGRTKASIDKQYSFLESDFADISSIKKLSLKSHDDEIVLINNAGTIGAIQRVSDQTTSDLEEVMLVNTIVPMLLCQKVIQENPGKKITIVNTSILGCILFIKNCTRSIFRNFTVGRKRKKGSYSSLFCCSRCC